MEVSFHLLRFRVDSDYKSGKLKLLLMNRFDTKSIRALLVTESKFITELLDKRNLPVTGHNESGKSSYCLVPRSDFIRHGKCVCCVQYAIYTALMPN